MEFCLKPKTLFPYSNEIHKERMNEYYCIIFSSEYDEKKKGFVAPQNRCGSEISTETDFNKCNKYHTRTHETRSLHIYPNMFKSNLYIYMTNRNAICVFRVKYFHLLLKNGYEKTIET